MVCCLIPVAHVTRLVVVKITIPKNMNNTDHTIERAYRVRLRLKPAQERALSRLLGAKRFVWNWAWQRKYEAWRTAGISLSGVDLSRELTLLKKAPQTCWLSELPSVPLSALLRDFDQAWKRLLCGTGKTPQAQEVWQRDGCSIHLRPAPYASGS